MIPVEKMSKKQRKEFYKKYRNQWEINLLSRRESKNKWKEKKLNEMAKERD